MSKVYLYKGKKYSNDYWCDNNFEYAGDLWGLLTEIAENEHTGLEQHTYTFFTLDGEQVADDVNGVEEEELLDEMLEGGYLDKVDIKELSTEDTVEGRNFNQTDYETEQDPESPFGVE